MHGGTKPLFHKDIQWSNIVQRADDPSRWFLIDWDDAAVPTTSAAMHLNQNYHSSSVFRDGHAGEVDVWAVGKVMSKASRRLLGFPSNIVAVGEKMQTETIGTEEALDMIKGFRRQLSPIQEKINPHYMWVDLQAMFSH